MNQLKLWLTGTLLLLMATTHAQDKYFTKQGRISFVSKGTMETIEALHKSVTCVLDTKSGAVQLVVLMKGFEFKKALMQEHFNENYVESDKYPQATFKGQVTNNSAINYASDGVYKATVSGKLTLHGETRDVTTDGTITVKQGQLAIHAVFSIQLADYKITIPALVKDKIASTVTVTVDGQLEPLKN